MTCAAGQFAICKVQKGRVLAECVDPPRALNIQRGFEEDYIDERQVTWLLETITGVRQNPYLQSNIEMLLSGTYENPETDDQVSFTLPEDFRRKLLEYQDRLSGTGTVSLSE